VWHSVDCVPDLVSEDLFVVLAFGRGGPHMGPGFCCYSGMGWCGLWGYHWEPQFLLIVECEDDIVEMVMGELLVVG
jgi:hypothetical protein